MRRTGFGSRVFCRYTLLASFLASSCANFGRLWGPNFFEMPVVFGGAFPKVIERIATTVPSIM